MLRFWEVEPWGPWRDNLHTAMVAREVRRSTIAPGKPVPPLSDWILARREVEVEPKAEKKKVFDFFRMIARKKVKIEKPVKKVTQHG